MSSSDLSCTKRSSVKLTRTSEALSADKRHVVFLVDKNGQLIASAGETRDIDTTSLASLTAGNIAATADCKASGRKRIHDTFPWRGERQYSYFAYRPEGDPCCYLWQEILSGTCSVEGKKGLWSACIDIRWDYQQAEHEKTEGKLMNHLLRKSAMKTSTIFQVVSYHVSFINYSSREINCKIVYYGPGLCGKTTNLQFVFKRTNPIRRVSSSLLLPKQNGRSSSISSLSRSAT